MKDIVQGINAIFEAIASGIQKVGKVVIEGELSRYIFALWCFIWGILGFILTVIYLLAKTFE